MLEFLLLTVLLGLWLIALDRLGGLPRWARSVIRGALLVVVVLQGALYTWVTLQARDVPVDQIGQTLAQIQLWTDRAHQASAALVGAAALILIALSVRRALRGPFESTLPKR